jgi:ParB family transcriptional regulator, chromosome partitioning protein
VSTKQDTFAARIASLGAAPARPESLPRGTQHVRIPVDQLEDDPANVRKTYDAEYIANMAATIAESGQTTPAIVWANPVTGKYRLVSGHCRARACRMAGVDLLATIMPRDVTDTHRDTVALIENVCRSNLRPMELANGYAALLKQWGVSQSDLARRLGVSQSHISKTLALLNLDDDAKADVNAGKVAAEAARRKASISVRGRYAGKRRGRRSGQVLELTTGTVRLKRGRTWDDLLAELQAVVAARRGDTDTAAAA